MININTAIVTLRSMNKRDGLGLHVADSLEMGAKALERHNPKKVDCMYSRVNARHETIYKCPLCCAYHLHMEDNFCKHCGQKLQWND